MSSDSRGPSDVADRYASALFDLSVSNSEIDPIATDLAQLKTMIGESADLRHLIHSPVFSSTDRLNAVSSLAEQAGFCEMVKNFLGVVVTNNRLPVLEAIINSWSKMILVHRGEVTAEVTSAFNLSQKQRTALENAIKSAIGSKITIKEMVDPALIGGLVVKVGSRLVDSSLRTKLKRLQLVMKGAA